MYVTCDCQCMHHYGFLRLRLVVRLFRCSNQSQHATCHASRRCVHGMGPHSGAGGYGRGRLGVDVGLSSMRTRSIRQPVR